MITIEDIIKEIKVKARFELIDDIIEKPSDEEINYAIFDALADINGFEPETNFKIKDILSEEDPRWRRILIIGATRNIVQTLVHDWTANGLDTDIGNNLSLKDRTSDFTSLLQQLTDDFNDKLEKLKTAQLKLSRVAHFSTRHGLNSSQTSNAYARRAYQYKVAARFK